jgi:hypothetical protein
MAISAQLNIQLHNIFLDRGAIQFPNYIKPHLAFENNNVFNLFLRVDISGPEIDVPLMCKYKVEEGLLSNYNQPNSLKEMAVSLFENSYPQSRRTANAIFKTFQMNDTRDRLMKITTNNGEVYYGGNGYILDKDYNLLILYTLHGVIGEDRILHYKTGRIYVNPKVFVSNGLIEKGIIKTVIPAFVQEGIMVDTSSFTGVTAQDINTYIRNSNGFLTQVIKPLPEIIVADVTDRFIVRPKKPTPSTFNNDTMNDYLLEHLDEVVKMTYIP